MPITGEDVYYGGGGGGGGGVIYTQSVAVVDGFYSFSVGAAGHGATSSSDLSSNGGDTYGLGRCAYGGGGGGTWYNWGPALSGASGGGGGIHSELNAAGRPGASGIEGQGNEGGASTNVLVNGSWNHFRSMGGGGGGAGAPGVSAKYVAGATLSEDVLIGGDGGDGVIVPITGEDVYYGGGGGGGGTKFTQTANGGNGGGGAGGKESGNVPQPGEAGTDGTGGGGGGGGSYTDKGAAGGDGGSGVAIIRFRRKEKGFIISFR